ncbi:MAG: S-layer homology domain-containing protein, partial [Clostridia bacterium]|nr:S-layer homology domain-containing protein [Clostridia bacterium]
EVTLEAVAPTCTETGLTEGKKCSVCGEILVAQETVEALGHTEETLAAVAPTCTETGLTEGKKCTVCGEITVAQETVDALGHTEETLAAVAPTCTETGLTEGKKCTVCGEITVAQEVVPALGHDFAEEFTVDVEATYEADGQKSRHCSRCDEKTDVTVIPKLVNSAEIFTDVKAGSWFKDAVDYAVYNGLMNGKTATTFAPNEATTRAQLVTVLWRLEGEPVVDVEVPFTDLKQDWYKDAVAWAYANGIVNGLTKTEFGPNVDVTREQIAAILYRYAEFKEYDVTASKDLDFTDANRVRDYAVAPMKWAYAEELITGSNEGGKLLLSPRSNATRAQIATILMRFCEQFTK